MTQDITAYSDDDPDTVLKIMKDDQGDIWISISNAEQSHFKSFRACTMQGGGQNLGLRALFASVLDDDLPAATILNMIKELIQFSTKDYGKIARMCPCGVDEYSVLQWFNEHGNNIGSILNDYKAIRDLVESPPSEGAKTHEDALITEYAVMLMNAGFKEAGHYMLENAPSGAVYEEYK